MTWDKYMSPEELEYMDTGFAGWMTFGLMATGNFNYYTDLYLKRYT